MSINLLNEGIDAARALAGNPHWAALRAALHTQVVVKMNAALEADQAGVHHATGYARALRDLWMAFEAATSSTLLNRQAKPGPVKNTETPSAAR